jgi:hypothetical protein
MSPIYEVLVGNVGSVYRGESRVRAFNEFDAYLEMSLEGRGRAAYEAVTMMCDGEPIMEYIPSNTSSESEENESENS